MCKYNAGQAATLQGTRHCLECSIHAVDILSPGGFFPVFAPCPSIGVDVHNGLFPLGRQWHGQQISMENTKRSLQPHIEEIGEVSVVDRVIVGRVSGLLHLLLQANVFAMLRCNTDEGIDSKEFASIT